MIKPCLVAFEFVSGLKIRPAGGSFKQSTNHISNPKYEIGIVLDYNIPQIWYNNKLYGMAAEITWIPESGICIFEMIPNKNQLEVIDKYLEELNN